MKLEHLRSRSSGSCRIKVNNTEAICSVNGPSDTTSSTQLLDRCYVTTSVFSADKTYPELESLLTSFFTQCVAVYRYPRCTVDMSFHITHNDGSLLSTLINGGLCSLLLAGISLLRVTPCVSFAVTESSFHADPNTSVEHHSNCIVNIAPTDDDKLVFLDIKGNFFDGKLVEIVDAAKQLSFHLQTQIKKFLIKK
ncbi:hypothetical protein P9112_002056 [Eukaryota sp. TZLM1-RC]